MVTEKKQFDITAYILEMAKRGKEIAESLRVEQKNYVLEVIETQLSGMALLDYHCLTTGLLATMLITVDRLEQKGAEVGASIRFKEILTEIIDEENAKDEFSMRIVNQADNYAELYISLSRRAGEALGLYEDTRSTE